MEGTSSKHQGSTLVLDVGEHKSQCCWFSLEENEIVKKGENVGSSSSKSWKYLRLVNPLFCKGVVKNWEELENIWKSQFTNTVNGTVSDTYEKFDLVVLEPILCPRATRNRSVKMALDTFKFSKVAYALSEWLSLVSVEKTSGLVLTSGASTTSAVPFYENHLIPSHVLRTDLGGSHVTHRLKRLLTEIGYSFFTKAETEMVDTIKCKLGYVALDFDKEWKAAQEA